MYEPGDWESGMISEESETEIILQSNITYLLDEEEFVDYVELNVDFS